MKTLKESLLDNTEKSLAANPASIMYPTPKVREFQKNVWGGQFIDWRCPGLIQTYIHNLDNAYFTHCSKSDMVGIRISIHSKYEIYTYLFTNDGSYSTAIELKGVGDTANSVPNAKKNAIEFFQYLANNPGGLEKIFAYANKCHNDLETKHMCNNKTYSEILKY